MLTLQLRPATLIAGCVTDVDIRLTNSSDRRIRGVIVELEIHRGLVVVAGDPIVEVDDLDPGENYDRRIQLLADHVGIYAVVVQQFVYNDHTGTAVYPGRDPLPVEVAPPPPSTYGPAPPVAHRRVEPLPSVFVNHRHVQTAMFAERFATVLSARLNRSRLVLDRWALEPGDLFMDVIELELRRASALVALIGPGWEYLTEQDGERRIMKADDVVRHEIAVALERKILVVPIIFGRTTMPSLVDLPADLAALPEHQCAELAEHTFERDAGLVAARLRSAGLR